MNKFLKSAILVIFGLLAIISVPVTTLAASTFQASNVHTFDTNIAVGGAATLDRNENSVRVRITTSGLDTHAAYSVWFVIFNNPAACTDGAPGRLCGGADLADPAVEGAVANAGGFVTGADGTGYMVGSFQEGPRPVGNAGFGTLKDSFTAEVHIVIQSHADILPGSVNQQISIPGAACNGDTCGDQFAVVFLATSDPTPSPPTFNRP